MSFNSIAVVFEDSLGFLEVVALSRAACRDWDSAEPLASTVCCISASVDFGRIVIAVCELKSEVKKLHQQQAEESPKGSRLGLSTSDN